MISPPNYKLDSNSNLIKYIESNKTFSGMATNNNEMNDFLINLTVSY